MFGFCKPKVSPMYFNMKREIRFQLESQGYSYTKNSVKKFQKDHNIAVTGEIDLETCMHLHIGK